MHNTLFYLINPIYLFLSSTLFFFAIVPLCLLVTDEGLDFQGFFLSGPKLQALLLTQAAYVFFVCFITLTVYLFLKLYFRNQLWLIKRLPLNTQDIATFLSVSSSKRSLRFLFILLISFIPLLFYLLSGHQKLLAIGTSIDSTSFRFIGFDDVPVVLRVANELVRRIILPILLLYEILCTKLLRIAGRSNSSSQAMVIYLSFLQILSSLSTLDRAPFLSLFSVVFFAEVMLFPRKVFRKAILFVCLSLGIIGVLTYIQYNITDFTFAEVVVTSRKFLLGRVVVDPSLTAAHLSYHYFSQDADFLNLEYSRLTGFFTGNYLGAASGKSLYVTPVGYIADVWRNSGIIGLFGFSLFSGGFFFYIDYLSSRTRSAVALVFFFISSILATMYSVYGPLFSLGGVAFALLPLLVLLFFKLKYS